jgi:hypothetical protein
VGQTICRIGKKVGVKVTTGDKPKYASAHDLRRSFGEPWASKLMPQQLMELMRHENIETTLRYYVGRNAQATAAILWQIHAGNTLSNSEPEKAESPGILKIELAVGMLCVTRRG